MFGISNSTPPLLEPHVSRVRRCSNSSAVFSPTARDVSEAAGQTFDDWFSCGQGARHERGEVAHGDPGDVVAGKAGTE